MELTNTQATDRDVPVFLFFRSSIPLPFSMYQFPYLYHSLFLPTCLYS